MNLFFIGQVIKGGGIMKITLHDKNGQEWLSNLLDTQELSKIEFELTMKSKKTTNEKIDYLKELQKSKKIFCNYLTYKEFGKTILFYLIDNYGNKKFLEIEEE